MAAQSIDTDVFHDRYAPYGTNGYSYGTGEDVTDWHVARAVQFMTPGSSVCVGVGVAEMTDGRVYLYCIRRPNHAENGRRKFASLQHLGTFESWARLSWGNERQFVDPASIPHYQAQIDAL
jgi:hypothetical protein